MRLRRGLLYDKAGAPSVPGGVESCGPDSLKNAVRQSSSSHRGALRPLMCPLPKRLKRVRRGSLATGHDLGDGDVTDEKKSSVVRVLFVRRCFPFLCPTSILTDPCLAFISVKKVCACEATCWSSVLTYFRLVVTHINHLLGIPARPIYLSW